MSSDTFAVELVTKSSLDAAKSPFPVWFRLSITILILERSSKYLKRRFSISYSLIFKDNGSLALSSFLSLFLSAMSKLPMPSLLKRILMTPFLDEKDSIFIGSSLPLNNSLIDVCKLVSPNETHVSPSNGALLTISNFCTETFACGKLLKRLRSASANDTLASTSLLMASAIFALIASWKKNGIANREITNKRITIPTIFNIFLIIMYGVRCGKFNDKVR